MTVPHQRTGRADTLEQVACVLLIVCLAASTFTIFGANLVALPGMIWLVLAFRERRMPVPAFFWPLAALAAWTLISCAFGVHPIESFKRSRQLLFFLLVPGIMRLLGGYRATTATNAIIALGAASALVGIVQYAALGYDDMTHRPKGTLGHYMTYSGLLMLVTVSAASRLVFFQKEWLWPAIAVPALLAAMLFTQSRNAWIGTAAAVAALMAVRNRKLLLVLPVIVAAAYVAAPSGVQQRMFSVFDRNDATSRDRFSMIDSGITMIRDRPLFGVGLNNVPEIYPKYKTAAAVDPADAVGVVTRAHLHNVPLQLAAERGIPAALIWLWFVVVAGRDLFRLVLHPGPGRALAGAGLAALVGMVAAGMFEHNFGDSEFLMLFLGIITLPFAAIAGPQDGHAGLEGPATQARLSR